MGVKFESRSFWFNKTWNNSSQLEIIKTNYWHFHAHSGLPKLFYDVISFYHASCPQNDLSPTFYWKGDRTGNGLACLVNNNSFCVHLERCLSSLWWKRLAPKGQAFLNMKCFPMSVRQLVPLSNKVADFNCTDHTLEQRSWLHKDYSLTTTFVLG